MRHCTSTRFATLELLALETPLPLTEARSGARVCDPQHAVKTAAIAGIVGLKIVLGYYAHD